MVNKLRKMPSGLSWPPGGGAPLAHAHADKREKPPRNRSFSGTLGGLKLRAAATQVHESISNLRRSGSTRLKSALKRRHSAPPDLEHPIDRSPTRPATPTVAELPGSPGVAATEHFNPDALLEVAGPKVKRFILDGERYEQHGTGIPKRLPDPPPTLRPPTPTRTPPPLDAEGMLRADLPATYFAQFAKNPFDAQWLAKQREHAVRFNDADALKEQLAYLNGLHLDAIHRADDLRTRFARLPLAAETLRAIERTEIHLAQQLMGQKIAVMDARKHLREAPALPPRPDVHELP